MKLNIKLRDGFNDDQVSIKVDGREIFDKSGVTTDLTISYADAVEIDTDKDNAKIEVSVNGESEQAIVNVSETPFVEVHRSADKLDFRESKNEVPML